MTIKGIHGQVQVQVDNHQLDLLVQEGPHPVVLHLVEVEMGSMIKLFDKCFDDIFAPQPKIVTSSSNSFILSNVNSTLSWTMMKISPTMTNLIRQQVKYSNRTYKYLLV